MNPFVLFSVAFATLSILLAYALLSLAHGHREWRTLAMQWAETGKEMMEYCDELEQCCAALESQATHNRDLTAAALLFMPRYLATRGEKLVVVGREAP